MAVNSGVLTILSCSLGFFFIFKGTLMLTPVFSQDFYKEFRKYFIKISKVFPLTKLLGFTVNPHVYRKLVATSEVVNGVALCMIPGPIKQVANVLLIFMMCGALATHVQMDDDLERMTPSIVFGLLLTCRLVIYMQVRARQHAQRIDNEIRLAREAKIRELQLKEKKLRGSAKTEQNESKKAR
ncbi:putative acetylcholine receptor chaperone [Tubulanus polymorphus]|uniref:putative acetylcholine receptor chaperone n=1 Tax=Tubulanus polymorphus TaxID=672921 RepID=UPI003DA2C00B